MYIKIKKNIFNKISILYLSTWSLKRLEFFPIYLIESRLKYICFVKALSKSIFINREKKLKKTFLIYLKYYTKELLPVKSFNNNTTFLLKALYNYINR